MVLGLVMLPFNAHHLGASEYGLWMLAASMVAYFPVLDLGFGARDGAVGRALPRAAERRGDQRGREHAGVRVLRATGLPRSCRRRIAWNLGRVFDLPPGAGAHRRLW